MSADCESFIPVSRRLFNIQLLCMLLLLSGGGCGTNDNELAGRVAIEVSVQIDGVPAADGTLVLRPDPGVKCPLIKVPVIAGIGRLDESSGPVSGSYQATFRPAEAGADISEQLSNEGRVDPTSGRKNTKAAKQGSAKSVAPKQPISLVVPTANPAELTANFSR